MGRLLILNLIIAVLVLVWRAFGPGTWGKGTGRSGMAGPGALGGGRGGALGGGRPGGLGGIGRGGRGDRANLGQPRIKGPDDDEDFLWRLEKQRFDEQRARERAAEAERERRRAEEQRRNARGADGTGNVKGPEGPEGPEPGDTPPNSDDA